jgi:uncharacterized protein YecT (DUF1311 family)
MEPFDLSKLDSDYQVLTELYRGGDSQTFLARHLELNRDVTITVVRDGAHRASLETFARDAAALAARRHANVVPVIEGRWLDDDTFAIVHARVRGSTLGQLAAAGGTLPQPRIGAALTETASALRWAREGGIVHRNVSPDSLLFQQGSGRVLLSFDYSPSLSNDETTIRSLAGVMSTGAPVNVAEYIAMLGAGAAAAAAAPTPVVIPNAPASTAPVSRDDSVVVVNPGMGFGARVLSAFVVLAALIVFAVLLLDHRHATPQSLTASGAIPDTQGDAAGDVALRSEHRLDSIAAASGYQPPVTSGVAVAPPIPPPIAAAPSPMMAPPPVTGTTTPLAPPVRRPVAPPTATDTSIGNPPPATDVCDSPALADQHRCLMNSVAQTDHGLNDVFQKLVAALRKQANVSDSDPDPQSVTDLRAAERRWLEQRDDACHTVGDGPLYARARAACFADQSSARVEELQQQLQSIP